MLSHTNIEIETENETPQMESETNTDSSPERDTIQIIAYLSLLAAFLIAASILTASFTISSLQNAVICGLELWQWSLLITVLLCGPLLSKLFQYLVDCLADTEYNLKDNVIYYVVELASKAWVVLWFSMILVAWLWVVHQPSYLKMPVNNDKLKRKYTKIFDGVTTLLTTLLIGSFLWLVKDGVLSTKKASFHIKRYFDRVRRALIHQVIVNKLLGREGGNGSGKCCNGGGKCCEVRMPNLLNVKKNRVSRLGMQKVIRWFLHYDSLTYFDGTMLKKIYSEDDARKAAGIIFDGGNGRRKIKDLLKKHRTFLEGENKDPVFEVIFRLLLNEQNVKEIELHDVEKLMVKMFRYRKILGSSLNGNMRLFRAVNRVISSLLVILIVALWFIMLRVETRNAIFVIASAIAGSAFLIGDTCATLFNCWFLIFVVHPYDIGDCCLIEGTPVTIKSIGILSTKGVTFDNEVKYYSNSKLFQDLSITNYTRSDNLGDFVEFYPENIATDEIQKGVLRYIEGKGAEHWDRGFRMEKEFDGYNKLKIKLHLIHTVSFQDFKERQHRKSELVQVITNILKGKNPVE